MLPLLLSFISSISTIWADDYYPTSSYHTHHIHLQVDANNSFNVVGLHNVLQVWATQQSPAMTEYMVARENLTARVMSFAYPSWFPSENNPARPAPAGPKRPHAFLGDDLLYDLAQGLCSFMPFRLPLHELRNEKGRFIYTTIQLGYDFKALVANTLNKHGFIDYAEDHNLKARQVKPSKILCYECKCQGVSLVHCWTHDDKAKVPDCFTYASADADCIGDLL
ncbi:hypothetical protein PRIPAC_97831 [Pristionchus pacificus]|uniref:Uncharacterized protein n=1 Tax=Pristionchus pacificus TaxID=54126 RepID=A0A2A6D0V3_PRIPA|nr:hypothetical protein PRIPAC_97831 [Pristionchus pacificus]|eukprot:PDM84008.1 hypothetical protein PRIPAC_34200 [Pristionchus pacificus]